MSAELFVPTLWDSSLDQAFHKGLVYGSPKVINRKYEGQIRQRGDTVKIKTVNRPTIKTYTKGSDHDAPEQANGAEQILRITEDEYFNVGIDDLDAVQADPEWFDEYTREGGYAWSDEIDQWIAAQLVANVASANLLGTDGAPKTPTAATAYELLVDLGVLLDENNVPEEGRYAVLPPWYFGYLKKDSRFSEYGTDPNRAVVRGEPIGEIDRMQLFKSNNVPNTNGTKYKIIAGVNQAATFAEAALGPPEHYRPQLRFEDALKQRRAWGMKITRPSALVCLTANAA